MRRPELPGFYFDTEKNRYFPLSHQKRARAAEQSADTVSPPAQKKRRVQHDGALARTATFESTPEDGVLASIHQRQISGNRPYGKHSSSARAFQGEYLEMHTAQPRVWKYSKTSNWADGGLEQLRVSLQTCEGEVEADVMTLGGTNGRLGVWQIAEPAEQDFHAHVFPAQHCLPTNPDLWTGEERDAPVLWPSMKTVVFPSKITSIKRLNEWSDQDRLQNGNRLQQSVLITTLGNGVNGGALYLLCPTEGYLSNPLQQYICALPFRLSTNVTTSQSVWTSESNPRGRSASLGMSSGAGIVDLEKGQMSWLCRCSSDVLSQQFDSSGNVVLCGFRNGVISTIDLRLPQPKARTSHSSDANMNRRTFNSLSKWQGTRHPSKDSMPYLNMRKSYEAPHEAGEGQWSMSNVDKLFCSHSTIMQMKSAVCSLALLRSSEWYLLASAMNGDIQQWDRRIVERGSVRSYEGHVNSHTVLQLGLDPTERLLVSGGEDCAIRIWSMNSGRLLHVESGLTSPVTTVSWPTSFRTTDSRQWGGFCEEPPYENDNPWALWMGSSSGLLHMRGAAK
ncbi:unnamed protein product [Calypogeia fissa]